MSGTTQDLVWLQHGSNIMSQFPEAEWNLRISQVPLIYREYIRKRIWREMHARGARNGQEATWPG